MVWFRVKYECRGCDTLQTQADELNQENSRLQKKLDELFSNNSRSDVTHCLSEMVTVTQDSQPESAPASMEEAEQIIS